MMPLNRVLSFAFIVAAMLICHDSATRKLCSAEPNIITNSLKMKLVEIPAGEFLMGSEDDPAETLRAFPETDPSWLQPELPRHKVKITRPFFIGQSEVTLNQFLIFYHAAKYKVEAEVDDEPSWGFDKSFSVIESNRFRPWDAVAWKIEMTHPAIYVSWNDAVAFCEWLSKKEGAIYRLPTEAEWEYACRAGSTERYSFGADPTQLVRFANVADASRLKALYPNSSDKKLSFLFVTTSDNYVWTAPAGKLQPNAFGLYDMHGNAWEWCSDWFDEEYYSYTVAEDPEGPGEGTERVLRGGGFYDAPFHQRCARRNQAVPTFRDYGTSFRVVREK